MKITGKKIRKYVLFLFLFILIYELVFALAPYVSHKEVSEEWKQSFDVTAFYGTKETKNRDRVSLVEGEEEAFFKRLAMLELAEETIDFSCYTIQEGVSTEYFFGALLEAADRGVKIRILLDSLMSGMRGEHAKIKQALLSYENIEYYSYNKINLLKPWWFNVRMHGKYIISDNKFLILGGRNIGDKYFNLFDFEGEFSDDRDVFLYHTTYKEPVTDSAVVQTREYFEKMLELDLVHREPGFTGTKQEEGKKTGEEIKTKYREWKEKDAFAKEHLTQYLKEMETDSACETATLSTNKVTFIHNPLEGTKKEPFILYQLLELTKQAKKSVLFQSPYTVLNENLIEDFHEIMQTKSFPLELLTNSLASSPNIPAFSSYLALRDDFISAGFRIYELQNEVSIHGKSMVFDEQISVVGSLNLDERSAYINSEVMLVIDSEDFAAVLTKKIKNYQNQSLVVGEENEYILNAAVQELPVSGGKRALFWAASKVFRLFRFLV